MYNHKTALLFALLAGIPIASHAQTSGRGSRPTDWLPPASESPSEGPSARALMDSYVIEGLSRNLALAGQSLAEKRADYGVREEHYDTVGCALLATLEQGIGVAYTPEVHEAWVDVYGVLSGTMKEAARLPS